MKVKECMSRDVRVVNAGEPIQEAATTMADIDAGVLPVAKDEKLVGMITDRDIAIRAVARGRGPTSHAPHHRQQLAVGTSVSPQRRQKIRSASGSG